MADLAITSTAVVAGSNSVRDVGTAGETIAAGKALYYDTTSAKWKLADSNSATAAARVASAIALNSASLNQPVSVLKSGDLTVNAVLTAGVAVYLSDTPGGLCPVADVGTGEYPQIVGIAKSTTVLAVQFQAAGVAL
jgi:hypothetical protein